jgi:hypothetical protein
VARETAEASLKAYQATLHQGALAGEEEEVEEITEIQKPAAAEKSPGGTEEGGEPYQATEAALETMKQAMEKAAKSAKNAGKETRNKMESRLESLAKMYEAKRNQQARRRTEAEDIEENGQ